MMIFHKGMKVKGFLGSPTFENAEHGRNVTWA
jgi:hypothetical protein